MNTYIIIGIALGLLLFIILIRRDGSIFSKNDISDINRSMHPDELMNNERLKFTVNEFIKKGKKLEAIKYLHENEKFGLLEAKNLVEKVEKIENMNRTENSELRSEVFDNAVGNTGADNKAGFYKKIKELIASGNTITAIKLAVEENKMGLAEAKEFVEKVELDIKDKKI